jgi:hypothetical protein
MFLSSCDGKKTPTMLGPLEGPHPLESRRNSFLDWRIQHAQSDEGNDIKCNVFIRVLHQANDWSSSFTYSVGNNGRKLSLPSETVYTDFVAGRCALYVSYISFVTKDSKSSPSPKSLDVIVVGSICSKVLSALENAFAESAAWPGLSLKYDANNFGMAICQIAALFILARNLVPA